MDIIITKFASILYRKWKMIHPILHVCVCVCLAFLLYKWMSGA